MTSVLSHGYIPPQGGWTGWAARRASAGLAVANSSECNTAARPFSRARREPHKWADAVLRPLARARHSLQDAPCLDPFVRL